MVENKKTSTYDRFRNPLWKFLNGPVPNQEALFLKHLHHWLCWVYACRVEASTFESAKKISSPATDVKYCRTLRKVALYPTQSFSLGRAEGLIKGAFV